MVAVGAPPSPWITRSTSLSLNTTLVSGRLLCCGYPQSVIRVAATPGVQVVAPVPPPPFRPPSSPPPRRPPSPLPDPPVIPEPAPAAPPLAPAPLPPLAP